eukprot:2141917-Rhodomonas_salina.1
MGPALGCSALPPSPKGCREASASATQARRDSPTSTSARARARRSVKRAPRACAQQREVRAHPCAEFPLISLVLMSRMVPSRG